MKFLIFDLFKEALKEWNKDGASLLAAALAYYGLFSLVPLLILSLIILNSLFGYGLLDGSIVQQAKDLAGRQIPGHVGDTITGPEIRRHPSGSPF